MTAWPASWTAVLKVDLGSDGIAIHGHLAAWGQRDLLLEVLCDDSKPLRALATSLDVMVMQRGYMRARFAATRSFIRERPDAIAAWLASEGAGHVASASNGVDYIRAAPVLLHIYIKLSRLAVALSDHSHVPNGVDVLAPCANVVMLAPQETRLGALKRLDLSRLLS
jgi:hypothetical protein